MERVLQVLESRKRRQKAKLAGRVRERILPEGIQPTRREIPRFPRNAGDAFVLSCSFLPALQGSKLTGSKGGVLRGKQYYKNNFLVIWFTESLDRSSSF